MHIPKPSDGGDFLPPPSGTWPAICTRFIDIGTQKTQFQGETKMQHKVILTWELRDDDAVMSDGRPFTISQRYTWSMSEKATLRKHLEGWRGLAFTDADFGPGGFDLQNVLGKSCLINVVHAVKDGKTYANIAGISRMPKGMTATPATNDIIYLALTPDRFDPAVFAKLSESLQATIKGSPEFAEMAVKTRQHLDREAPNGDELNDEIPF
jgi:hypothetical protein